MSNLKIVAEFYNEYEAEIARGRLEAEGIESVIMNLNSSYPGVQMGRHGIQLMVHAEDLESAQMILDSEPADPDASDA